MNPTEATTTIVSEMQKAIAIKEEQMSIEPDKVDIVAGSKRSNVKRLEKIYGVKITLPAKGGSKLVIKGPADMVSAAKEDIKESISYKTSFFIEKKFDRLVLGPKGERAEHLKTKHDVRIITINEDGEVKPLGKKSGCEAVKEAIESIINAASIASFFVEERFFGMIIGWKGENRRFFEDAHGVTIEIDNEDGKVVIVGEESECEACKEAIESMIEEKKVFEPMEKFYVPSRLLGSVAGLNFSNVNRIDSTYNVKVTLPSKIRKEQTEIWVKGTSVEDVSKAKKDILDNLPWKLCKDLDESYFGSIIGRGGATVKQLCREFSVRIVLKDGKVTILGRKYRTEAARKAIDSIICDERERKYAAE